MKKMYTGLKAEKVDFGRYDMVTLSCPDQPGGCIQIVANEVDPGGSSCKNPYSTTQYMWINDSKWWCDDT